MARTLLIGNPGTSWREWLREHRGNADLLVLDPADASLGFPARLRLFRANRPFWTRFYGSLDPQRAPHVLLATLAQALAITETDLMVQCFAYRPVPVLRQTVTLLAQVLQPDRILVAEGTDLDQSGFTVGPEPVELEPAFPAMVQQAQRKAQWLKLFEECSEHTVNLREICFEGTRLGTGRALSGEERRQAGLKDVLYAERAGSTLFLVADRELEDSEVTRALDATGTAKASLADPGALDKLLLAFARESGEELGMGAVGSVDWASFTLRARCTAVPPAPVRLLRIGSLRVDPKGRELGEIRPWQV